MTYLNINSGPIQHKVKYISRQTLNGGECGYVVVDASLYQFRIRIGRCQEGETNENFFSGANKQTSWKYFFLVKNKIQILKSLCHCNRIG